jgi:hypothetical protein
MKSIFKLLLVLAMFGTTEFLAITPPNEIEKQPIEFSIADPGDVIVSQLNFVNLSMDRKVKTFSEHQLNNTFYFDEASPIDMDVVQILRQVNRDTYKKSVLLGFDKELNILDKMINQMPVVSDLHNSEHPFEFVLNKTEFKKIEHLLDKDNKYKNFKVTILDKAPDDLIYLRQKQSSKYF